MKSNQDFRTLIASGDVVRDGSKDKVRFDINQISKWEKEMKTQYDKKSARKEAQGSIKPSSTKSRDEDDKYRDRANERRKEVNKEEEKNYEDLVSKLDAEQTKFLGGDIEHTHLVKGLDFALLQKMRTEQQDKEKTRRKVEEAEGITFQESIAFDATIEVESTFGEKLKKFFVAQHDTKAKRILARQQKEALSRTFFEFDIDPNQDDVEAVDYVPLIISKSKKDITVFAENYMNYVLTQNLLSQLRSMFDAGKLKTRKKKRPRPIDGERGASKSSVAPPPPPLVPQVLKLTSGAVVEDSIYGDELEVPVGKYVYEEGAGSGGVERSGEQAMMQESESTREEGEIGAASSGTATVKGIFNSLSGSSAAATSTQSGETKEDRMKSVQNLLTAQARRERVQKEKEKQASSASVMEVGKDSQGNDLVHRDVFATTKDEVVKAKTSIGETAGDAFGLKGSYEDYLNYNQYDDIYDSDDDGGKMRKMEHGTEAGADDAEGGAGREGDKKDNSSVSKISSGAFGGDKADSRSGAKWGAGKGDGSYFGVSMDDTATKAKSTAKKSLLKSSTPWNRAGASADAGSGGGGGGGGKTPSARSQRRALIHKKGGG